MKAKVTIELFLEGLPSGFGDEFAVQRTETQLVESLKSVYIQPFVHGCNPIEAHRFIKAEAYSD